MTTEHWHLKKEFNIGLLFAIAIQTGGAVYWAASMTERMDQIERRMDNAAVRSQNVDNLVAQQATQIAVLVSRIDDQTRRIEETNDLLRQYLHQNGPRP